ncbi:MAG TPA: DHHA1 domain-containing protein, partial [Opitutales bacterium]|nr:DHHA1 domain-containing protein [Opitutales bacterium]
PWLDLCTAGLAFKFAHALLKELRGENDSTALATDIRETLDLVALGTIADLVSLTGENRILARKGLEKLQSVTRTGLAALFEVSGIETGQPVTPFDIAFRLSPRINASGRLADAGMAVDMLRGNDWTACLATARELDRMNRERQDIERGMAQQAMEIVDAEPPAPAIVLHSDKWHQGVAGIVASRLANHYHRPAIVLCTEDGGLVKGSGRSAAGVSLTEALAACTGHLETWGGHPMAVGVTLRAEKLTGFRKAFCAAVEGLLAGASREPSLEIAGWVNLDELGDALFREIDLLGPFGQGNPEPVFAIRGAKLSHPAASFGSGHCRFSIDCTGGNKLACVAWRAGERIPPCGRPIDIAARLTWNVWKGRRIPQLGVEDWRFSEPAGGAVPLRTESFAGQTRRLR